MSREIGTIEQELAECLAEIAKYPDAKWFWCLHHEQLCEELTEPVKNRIGYIQKHKPEEEQTVRFRNLRPVKNPAHLEKAWAEYNKVAAAAWAEYNKVKAPALADVAKQLSDEWSDNTWTGKSIFDAAGVQRGR